MSEEKKNMIAKQLKETKEEVTRQKPLITENVIQQLDSKEDSMIMKYSALQDIEEISKNIESIFKDEHAVRFLTDAAKKMVGAFKSSSAMKELQRWNQVKKVRNGN